MRDARNAGSLIPAKRTYTVRRAYRLPPTALPPYRLPPYRLPPYRPTALPVRRAEPQFPASLIASNHVLAKRSKHQTEHNVLRLSGETN